MLGKRINELRKALGLSQIEFGEKIGAHHSSVSEWENNKVDIKESTLTVIELRYNVNPQWLRQGTGKMFLTIIPEELKQITEWMKTLTNEEAVWLKVEMLEKFPRLKYWLEKNK